MTDDTEIPTDAETLAAANLLGDLPLLDLPRIGAAWPGQGGTFAGLVRGQNGAADYLLILGPEFAGDLTWQEAMDRAVNIEVDSHKDFTLPTRAEQAVLFGNLRDHFTSGWYWSCEQHADGADYAWFQNFGNGVQVYWGKHNRHRARAVRRLVVQ